jgi:hypothetical protein
MYTKQYTKTWHDIDILHICYQCRRARGEAAPDGPEGGPGPDHVTYVFVFVGSIITCRLYKSTISFQAQISMQLRVSRSDLVIQCNGF